jgi:2-polyprenyl-6-methoxyphenol hydroxylase-like FAD-dependent oxidoreductase
MIARSILIARYKIYASNVRCLSSQAIGRAGERMKVAIVGGGAAGLSAALHLAPLVSNGVIEGPIDVFEPGTKVRDIGVGIWSTALDSFQNSERDSHQLVYNDMTKHGTFVSDVGYRCPQGHWLVKSSLKEDLPRLLMLREADMLKSLRQAVHLEEQRGTVSLKTGNNFKIHSIAEDSTHPWSAPLLLNDEEPTERDYHLIVAADGMHSILRKRYGGHFIEKRHLSGTTALPSPLDLPQSTSLKESWEGMRQAEATSTQDREYTVFRGNSRLTTKETGLDVSFQTWGEGHSMRFAAVPMTYLDDRTGRREERQVFFITTNDNEIMSETDPALRKEKLMEAFSSWHDPIVQIVQETPPGEILMERAMAHKHCMSPVTNYNKIVKRLGKRQPSSAGGGPAIVFVGDAFMTVDPILAQGYTIGMEGAAALATSLQLLIQSPQNIDFPSLAFDPYALRFELNTRHEQRLGRLICLLRATEIVQALGQPTGTLTGLISRNILRPLMRVTPDFIKAPFFNAMLKYSLGVSQSNKTGSK